VADCRKRITRLLVPLTALVHVAGCRCGDANVAVAARIEPSPLHAGEAPRCVAPGAQVVWMDGPRELGPGPAWPAGVPLPAAGMVTCRAVWPDHTEEVRAAVSGSSRAAMPPNLLILLGDDIGADQLTAFSREKVAAPTPVLDQLAAQGIAFQRAYAASFCSPTRAMLLTGRYPRRSGVGTGVHPGSTEPDLPAAEVLLPELLTHAPRFWDSSAIGKWHLTAPLAEAWRAPLDQGFRWWAGTPGNLSDDLGPQAEHQSYFSWLKSTNGVVARAEGYATTDEVNDAIARTQVMSEPWLMYVAFHAAHTPLHQPPRELLPPGAEGRSEGQLYDEMVAALDHEIGRLLDSMDPELRARTIVVFLGDNGTSAGGAESEDDRVKGSLFEGGIRVPLIVAGPGVAVGRSEALVDATDVWATVAELAGVTLPVRREDGSEVIHDGTSFVPYFADPALPTLRRWAWAEQLGPSGCVPGSCRTERVALIGTRFKMTVDEVAGTTTMVDLQKDPGERHPLDPGAEGSRGKAIWADMQAEVERWRARLGADLQR
jgi:arylsulfatase A-like enzyme